MTADKVELQLAALHAALEAHTAQDMSQFSSMLDKLEALDEKIDALLIREARREGEAIGARKSAATMAAVVSFVITIVAQIAQAYFG